MHLTAAECLSGVDIIEPQVSPDGRWLALVLNGENGPFLYRLDLSELFSSEGDKTAVARQAQAESVPVAPITTEHLYARPAWSRWPVRSGRSLSGGCFAWLPDSTGVVVVARSGELWVLPIAGEARLISATLDEKIGETPRKPLSSPVVDPSGQYVAVTIDQAQVWTINLATTKAQRVDQGDHDFVADPVWWMGQTWWVAWSVPHMPWDTSVLVNGQGEVSGPPGYQIQQPQVAQSGQLWGWLDDSSGWLNVQIAQGSRVQESHEHGGPSWGERQRSWCFDAAGSRVAFVRNEDGFGRLCSVDLSTGHVVERARAVHGQLSWAADTLVALRTGATTPPCIVAYDTSNRIDHGVEHGDDLGAVQHEHRPWPRRDIVVGSSAISKGHPSLVEPQLVQAESVDGAQLFARLYVSSSSQGRLLCWIHGGPTDQWTVSFMPRFVYWLDRGYDILVPDHRGSTGHGRAYTQAIRGQWGNVDVEDVHCLVQRVLQERNQTPLALMGSSAGGMTALAFLARYPDLAAAAVVAYPVSDIAALDDVTHRFEAHYNRSLLGSPEETQRLSSLRSPRHHVAAISATPLLIFHGTEDPVVPIAQSEELVASLGEHGADVEYVVFEGEGHGFRDLDHKIYEYIRTEDFLRRHLAP